MSIDNEYLYVVHWYDYCDQVVEYSEVLIVGVYDNRDAAVEQTKLLRDWTPDATKKGHFGYKISVVRSNLIRKDNFADGWSAYPPKAKPIINLCE